MNFGIVAGDTDKTIYLRLRDSITGLAKTGLVYNSAGATCSYVLPLAARAAITLATQTVTGAHTDGGFVEVDATNCRGLYRLDLPDAAIASGAFTIISIEFDGIIEESVEIELDVRKANVTTMAADVITSTVLASSAITEIQSGLSTLTTSQVNAEVLDVLNVDTFAEPGQGTPGATITLAAKINYIYKFLRNKLVQTSTQISIYNDNTTTVDHKSTVSTAGTTYTKGEFVTGP